MPRHLGRSARTTKVHSVPASNGDANASRVEIAYHGSEWRSACVRGRLRQRHSGKADRACMAWFGDSAHPDAHSEAASGTWPVRPTVGQTRLPPGKMAVPIRAMIQRYSDTTMPARVIRHYYAEYHKDMPLAGACGWRGPASEAPMEMHEDLLDRSCPTCDTMLLVVGYHRRANEGGRLLSATTSRRGLPRLRGQF